MSSQWSKCCGLTTCSRVSPQQNEIFVLTIKHTYSDLKVHVLHYANELLVRVWIFQNLLQTRLICRNNLKKCLGKEYWRVLVINKSTYHEKPHFDLYFTTISTSKKMCFFRVRAEKGIAWHIDASSVVETLIYHGKLANQIARLAAIVVKKGWNDIKKFSFKVDIANLPTPRMPRPWLNWEIMYEAFHLMRTVFWSRCKLWWHHHWLLATCVTQMHANV